MVIWIAVGACLVDALRFERVCTVVVTDTADTIESISSGDAKRGVGITPNVGLRMTSFTYT